MPQILTLTAEDLVEVREAVGHWLTPPRVRQLGMLLAGHIERLNRAGGAGRVRSGALVTASGLPRYLPFTAPTEANARDRQRWRNAQANAVLGHLRTTGWLVYTDSTGWRPGPAWYRAR